MAIAKSSPAPLLLLDGQLNIIAASTSFCAAFSVDAVKLTGQPLYVLDDGNWAVSRRSGSSENFRKVAVPVTTQLLTLRRTSCALAAGPTFARAYAGLSFPNFQTAFLRNTRDVSSEGDLARNFAERAMDLNPLDPSTEPLQMQSIMSWGSAI